ncbi:MAG TPA: tRNA lysidine(34) synthetase TilS [Dehalococcoidales bacterium]|nr:tRNA lysidine(34) synthetase TilS [Dehalococcoidales bacterium]
MVAKESVALGQLVLHFIQEQHLIPEPQKLVVAVSGGPDSVCLLHILVKLREKLGISLHVAHLNHQLRGAEAEADAQYVADLARQLDLPATIERRDVKAYQAKQRLSLEEAAREVRYTFLAQVARSIEADRVAVGHTVDDHIETILMHLIRGTGTRGLRGLQPSSQWQSPDISLTVIRPLLPVSREETADYCRYHQLKPRLDASNLSLSPLRNRIRQQLLPLLQSYNPQVVEALLRTARIAADDLAFLDKEVARLWSEIAREHENTIILDKAKFAELPSALQRYLLRTSIEKLLGNLKDIETRHIEEIMAALNKPAGKRISLPEGLIFSIEYDRYLLGPDPAALSPFPVLETELALKVPGKTPLPGWQVAATIINQQGESQRGEAPLTHFPPPFSREGDKGGGLPDSLTAYFDLDKAGRKLTVRTRQPGDRFQPLGMDQPKKLNEFMIDSKIPHPWRRRVPIVCSPEHLLWVVGWRIDDRVKVTEGTRRVLRLEMMRSVK